MLSISGWPEIWQTHRCFFTTPDYTLPFWPCLELTPPSHIHTRKKNTPFGLTTYQQLLNEAWGLNIKLSSSWWETRSLTYRWSFWWPVGFWEGIEIVDGLPSNLLMVVLTPTSILSQLPLEGAQMLLQRAGFLGALQGNPFDLKAWPLFSKCCPSTWDARGYWIGIIIYIQIVYIYIYLFIYVCAFIYMHTYLKIGGSKLNGGSKSEGSWTHMFWCSRETFFVYMHICIYIYM